MSRCVTKGVKEVSEGVHALKHTHRHIYTHIDIFARACLYVGAAKG